MGAEYKKLTKAFRRRLARQYSAAPHWGKRDMIRDGTAASPRIGTAKVGAASDVRSLDGDELAARKAELETRGLPATKKVVAPKYLGKVYAAAKRQTFFPSGREARKGKS